MLLFPKIFESKRVTVVRYLGGGVERQSHSLLLALKMCFRRPPIPFCVVLSGLRLLWFYVTCKTARMPDLAIFSTQDSKVLLRLGKKLLKAYTKGDKIIEMYQVFFARMVRHRP